MAFDFISPVRAGDGEEKMKLELYPTGHKVEITEETQYGSPNYAKVNVRLSKDTGTAVGNLTEQDCLKIAKFFGALAKKVKNKK